MPRSRINKGSIDLNRDNGAVLWSIIQGEQFEFTLTLKYLTDVTPLNFKAVIIEGLNLVYTGAEDPDTIERPQTVRPGGKQDILTVRKPVPVEHDTNASYPLGQLVKYGGLFFKSIAMPTVGTLPTDTTFWEPYEHNKVYLQFTVPLSSDWAVQPLPTVPTYGFFEMSITDSDTFAKTMKSIRGPIEFLYSPTSQVP